MAVEKTSEIKAKEENKNLITSESVTEGHPDKICDQISDAVLDALLEEDPESRVACETAVTTGQVNVFGEITTKANVDISNVVRETLKDIGYTKAKYGFDCDTCGVSVSIDEQSPDIAMGVDGEDKNDVGAGDQGMMYGYATDETEEFMPMPIMLAHRLSRKLSEARRNGEISYLRPDGKTQVTVEYENNQPSAISNILISAQHPEEVDNETIENDLIEKIIKRNVPENLITDETEFLINPTGRFVVGGPQGDAGVTGRKIVVDTYGGIGRIGGGAFSGKDPSKVDRSAAYAARYAAKNVVAAGLANRCEVSVAYSIGVAKPVSLWVNTFGTGKVSEEKLSNWLQESFDWRPAAIIDRFELKRPIYRQTAAYGHFGRNDLNLPWEKLDMVKDLKNKESVKLL
ncbi:methionine adenosyltransferase [Natranaerobius thermophilus]|uniref:S-adenosylmethionine synthase n=1 Tax=Natranaerobius thermophilus (strain ATCC BAA-1301 / DSM 18059 / JW/NM-WN-LF) TaxID=457570 RepID=B2A774_NATTJ|nr:methionine adenosyltransferase [Natranaerobius thermophilus]ACB84268.1 methionine adenosyltransferase [Natranaerobius thermophilus JW/NM-WN-LF]